MNETKLRSEARANISPLTDCREERKRRSKKKPQQLKAEDPFNPQ